MAMRGKLILVAALAALLLAVVAWDATRGSQASAPRVVTVSNKTASRILSTVPVPAGFRGSSSCPHWPLYHATCFHRLPSLVLTDARWGQILGELGVPVLQRFGCSVPKTRRVGQPTTMSCSAFGQTGGEQLALTAWSVVRVLRSGFAPSSAVFAHLRGTYLLVHVVGRLFPSASKSR